MCGIMAIASKIDVSERLISGIEALEYRGYDSAGIALLTNDSLTRLRSVGKISALRQKYEAQPIAGNVGIAHTRWATHGLPNEANAHPHMTDEIALVHNGIIENFSELRKKCQDQGCVFSSTTDTEVLVHLLQLLLQKGLSPQDAVLEMEKQLHGAYALAILFKQLGEKIIAVRNGPPLAVGYGEGENFLASDDLALAKFSDRITYLQDGDFAIITPDNVEFFDRNKNKLRREIQNNEVKYNMISKGSYRHFMQKEMYEQPEAIMHSLAYYIDYASDDFTEQMKQIDWRKISHISFLGCGSAYYATLVARYWFETYAGLSVANDVASEFRYRDVVFPPHSLALFVSQSGETADSLAALRYCKELGIPSAVIVNIKTSTMAREADYVFPTLCGPEIGVASTKAFTSQLAVLLAMSLYAGYSRGRLDAKNLAEKFKILQKIPSFISKTLKKAESIREICNLLSDASSILYLGRGTLSALACEGALKLKELSYLHAEGYAAGELKHGPIALVEPKLPIIVLAPKDKWLEKTISNIEEVLARKGEVIMFSEESSAAICHSKNLHNIILPPMDELITPIIYAIPVQLVAYYTAISLGTDVDQPRNLAKSVTVE